VGTLGVAACLSVLGLTFTNPLQLEQALKGVISQQVSKQVGRAVDAFDERFVAEQAGRLHGRLGAQAEIIRERLRREIPTRVSEQVARMQDPDCECRRVLRERLASVERQMQRLPQFIQQRYAETVRGMLRELRLFAGINAAAFALVALAGALGLRREAAPDVRRWLGMAAGLLTVSTLAAASLYVFNQNWLETLLFNRWVGWGYAAWLGLLFAWLCDLVLNRARVTRHVLGSVNVSVSPC
jgi:hypothetical protein